MIAIPIVYITTSAVMTVLVDLSENAERSW